MTIYAIIGFYEKRDSCRCDFFSFPEIKTHFNGHYLSKRLYINMTFSRYTMYSVKTEEPMVIPVETTSKRYEDWKNAHLHILPISIGIATNVVYKIK